MVASTATFGVLISAKTKGKQDVVALGNSMQGVQGKVKNLKMAVGGLNTAFKALGAALAVGVVANFARRTIDAADAFGKLSTRTGIAANALQGYVNAGKLADVSQKQLEVGLKTFARTSFEASQGIKTYAEAYDLLGVSVRASDGNLKASDVLLGELADKFKELPDGPQKAALAMRIFGKSGADMITLLNGGSQALSEFSYDLSNEFAPRAELFNDTITKIGFKFEELSLQLFDKLLPALQVLIEQFATLFEGETKAGSFFSIVEGGIRGIAIVVMATIKLFDRLIKSIGEGAGVFAEVIVGDFGEAFRKAKSYYLEFGKTLQKDKEIFDLLAFGSADAPAGRKPTKGFTLPTITPPGGTETETPEQKAAKKYQEQLRTVAEASQAFNNVSIEVVETVKQQATAFDGVRNAADTYLETIGTMQNGVSTLATTAFQGLEDSLTRLVTTGKANFQDFARSILQATARMIVQQTILAGVMQLIRSIGGGGSPFQAGTTGLNTNYSPGPAPSYLTSPQFGVAPFAKGGIFDKPTMFAYANGGVGRFGLMGEAGPEAIMPLKRGPGGRLGVEASAGVGNIVVNVDASGTQAQGDTANSRQLGEAIGSAVRQELLKQKRPGGMLA